MDKYYLSRISPDPYSYSFLSMWIGFVATAIFMLVMRIPLRKKHLIGSYVDPNFQGLILPRGRLLLFLILAGISSATSTLSYFYIVGASSPSLLLPFSQLVIIYLMVSESAKYKETPTTLEIQSIVMIIIGIFLVSTTDLTIDWVTILLIIGPYNLSLTVYAIAMRQAKRMLYKRRKNDSLNLRFWSLTFNALLMAILVIPFITPSFYAGFSVLDSFVVFYIVLVMLISTFSYISYIRALGIAKMSIITAILSFAVVLGIPFTLIGDLFFPGAFGPTNFTPLFWLFKSMGILLIITGIIAIAISQVKAYVLIYLSGSAEPVIHEISNVKGITSISAVSGDRLLIATLVSRSLGKTYRTLMSDLEKIKGIEKVITLTSIKEWEIL